jgi:DNA-binding MarR family transcriptional regulator
MRASDLHRLARTLREIALDATGNTGSDRVNAGELAVLEDIARHPASTIRDITEHTGLAQSLVSRIVRAAADEGALSITPDERDRRKVRVELSASTRGAILKRAGNPLDTALAAHTPDLTDAERRSLQDHLSAAAELLQRASRRPSDSA